MKCYRCLMGNFLGTTGTPPCISPKSVQKKMSVALICHRDVYDGEHHEYVRLQHHDQDVEYRPKDAKRGGTDHADEEVGAPRTVGGPQPQQQENDLAGVHVAVQPQRMR